MNEFSMKRFGDGNDTNCDDDGSDDDDDDDGDGDDSKDGEGAKFSKMADRIQVLPIQLVHCSIRFDDNKHGYLCSYQ